MRLAVGCSAALECGRLPPSVRSLHHFRAAAHAPISMPSSNHALAMAGGQRRSCRLMAAQCSDSLSQPVSSTGLPQAMHLPLLVVTSAANAMQLAVLLLSATSRLMLSLVSKTRHSVASLFPDIAGLKGEDVQQQLRQLYSHAKLMAFIAPFAKAASSDTLTAVYTRTFERAAFGFAKMYLFLLFMRVLLSWFPSIDWNANPWTFLRLITEPYLQIYRGILPPLFGQLDFTPLFGFLILQDVVEVMAPTYTMGMHAEDTSTRWTTSDVMCYFDGF